MPELTRTLLDIYSVSGEENTIADAVYKALSAYPHLHLTRDGDAMIARTEFGPRNGEERTRILLAGHLDTVPLPTVRDRSEPYLHALLKITGTGFSTGAVPPI